MDSLTAENNKLLLDYIGMLDPNMYPNITAMLESEMSTKELLSDITSRMRDNKEAPLEEIINNVEISIGLI